MVKPYSVSATNPMGMVEMMTPATGMKEQIKTKRDSSPAPGMASTHMPAAVSAVLTAAMRACASSALPNSLPKTANTGTTSS